MFLQAIPSPPLPWAQFNLGLVVIHTYALCILAGIVAAVLITGRRLKARGVNPGAVVDVAIWAVPLGIIGARLWHVFTHGGDYFSPGADLWNVFAIWDGGNAIFGSMVGGVLGIVIACRRVGLRATAMLDALAPAMLVAQAIGRLGNYFNHELFGLPTTLPWGLQIEATNKAVPPGTPPGSLFHPLFLYEMVFDLLGAALIVYLARRFVLQWGKQVGMYLVWYGLVRSWLESVRIDPTSDRFLTIPANDWAAFAAVALGIIILTAQARRQRGPEPSPMLPSHETSTHAGSQLEPIPTDPAGTGV